MMNAVPQPLWRESNNRLKAIFMGTPAFAATILEHILKEGTIDVVAVYTQPDRPSGRGNALKESEVKKLAVRHGLPVLQPQDFKDPAVVKELALFKPDVLLVVAYGLLLPKEVLDIPLLLPINVHASLLPKYRGAAPVQRAIMEGNAATGVTIMRMEAGLDTGPILLQQAMGIDIDDTSASLLSDLATSGGELLIKALDQLSKGTLTSLPQDEASATYAPKLRKEEGILNFSVSMEKLHAQLRGLTPWPGGTLIVHRPKNPPLLVRCDPGIFPFMQTIPFSRNIKPGDIGGIAGDALVVRCIDGWYAFTSLRPAGKNVMTGKAFYNGYLAGVPGCYIGDKRE